MDDLLKPIGKIRNLEPGTIIRRIGKEKDQQGCFLKFDENHNMILGNIIDLAAGTLLANEGVLKPQASDKIYYYDSSFSNSPAAEEALKIIRAWPIYKKHKELQEKIITFISVSFVPEQVVEMSKKDSLQLIFVPVQQKFRVGRFPEKRTPDRVCKDTFMMWLESIGEREHITYLAHIPHNTEEEASFYSSGTKSHEETAKLLQKEMFRFDPTHGGHIKNMGAVRGILHFAVDTGSRYMGLGVKSPLQVSVLVADELKKLYPEFEFTPLAGRGAAVD